MRHLLRALAAALAVSIAIPAQAQTLQTFALDRFEPAPAGDRFFGVHGGNDAGHGSVRAQLLGEYAYRPLVLYTGDGDDRVGSIVSDQLWLHGGLALGLWNRLTLSLNVPVALLTAGDSPAGGGLSFESPSGAAFGDIRLGARLRLLGKARSAFQLGLNGYVWLPTGAEDQFASDGSVRGQPSLFVSGETSDVAYALTAGAVLRETKQVVDTEVGSELSYGASIAALLAGGKLQLGPELYGTTTFNDPFSRDTTNAEAILGAKLRVGSVVLGAGAGPGLTRGLGTPALRVVASVAIVPEDRVAPAPPSDRDGDGIPDVLDACPDHAGAVSDNPRMHGCPDRDGDGVMDRLDACVDVAGARSVDPKKNGCPSDRDGDGIIDSEDACPDVPGVASDTPKKNGCPADRDEDGIIDSEDACPDIKGVRSDDPTRNGCPGDMDGDGVTDDKDACPSEKGKPNADPTKNGCPTLVRVTQSEIIILQQVQFKTGSHVILPASDELLQQVSDVLREHPEIVRIEVQGHTDNRGSAAYNQGLSQRRAASVVKWLVGRGQIEDGKLVAKGYGFDQPIASNDTDDGRQQNRRVQFKIIETQKKSAQQGQE